MSFLPVFFCVHERNGWRQLWSVPTVRGRLRGQLGSWAVSFVPVALGVGRGNAELDSSGTEALLASQGIQCGHWKSFLRHTHGGPLSLGPVLFQGPGQAAVPSGDDDVRSQMEMCSVYSDRCGETARPVTIPSGPRPPEAATVTPAVGTMQGLGPAG